MSLTCKSLNGDSAFLLTFSPPIAPSSSPQTCPPRFTILIDPWLVGTAVIIGRAFSLSEQKLKPCITSLQQLDQEPDLVIISQDKPDHCHEETLRQLPKECQSTILAIPSAAKRIRSWNHFRPEKVQTIPKYIQSESRSLYRHVLPPTSSRGSCGLVSVAWVPERRDVSGLHHAIGITYRPPSRVFPGTPAKFLDLPELPPSPPASPRSFRTISSSTRTVVPAPDSDREKTLSVIYSPHGVSYRDLQPYASAHLVSEAALPLSALIHSFDRVENPWYLGGNISSGTPGGIQIAESLYAKCWISAHDAEKINRGLSVKQTRIGKFTMEDIRRLMAQERGKNHGSFHHVNLVSLTSGEEHQIESE